MEKGLIFARRPYAALIILIVVWFGGAAVCRADDFGDISVTADSMYSGNTFHGYAAIRVILENRSDQHTHYVTIAYPNNAYGYGNSISRLSRSLTLAPSSREVTELLQPPLPASGDGAISVQVDGYHAGEVRAPNANNHCNYTRYGGNDRSATVFISRSLDFDAVRRIWDAGKGGFTAAMAVGPPDASGGGRYDPNAWMPDPSDSRHGSWLELDYATPQAVNSVSMVSPVSLPSSAGDIELLDKSSSRILSIPISSGIRGMTGSASTLKFSFPVTASPVKTLRLNFGSGMAYGTTVDAVQITGPTGSQWASDARASSDNSSSAPSYPGAPQAVQALRAELPVSAWSSDWLAYTPFDVIAVQSGDLTSMPSETLDAIGSYVRAGGELVVLGATELPQKWRFEAKDSLAKGEKYDMGFGHCFVFAGETSSALDEDSVATLRMNLSYSANYWRTLPTNSANANGAMPLVANLQIPVRGIVLVMLLFVIVIGPANIGILIRRKRRTWMLWTIPAISFTATMMVFAYSFLREGITPTVRIAGVTYLDQSSHEAETIGAEGFYCPLTPSSGLHFDSETEATPLVENDYGSGNSREVDWTQSQHLGSGWVVARVPAFFHVRKAETRRERLQIENKGGKLRVINGLGATIKAVWFADANRNVYEAQDVGAGASAELVSAKLGEKHDVDGPELLLHDIGFMENAGNLKQGAASYLMPNTYIAELNGNPFMENALETGGSAKLTKTSAVVYGTLDGGDHL